MSNAAGAGLTGAIVGFFLGGPAGAIVLGSMGVVGGAIADGVNESDSKKQRIQKAMTELPNRPSDRQVAQVLDKHNLTELNFERRHEFPVNDTQYEALRRYRVKRK